MDKTGSDSKDRQRFDRYAVVSPCVGFEPIQEFEMKFQWAENAISFLRKAHLKFSQTTFDKSSTVKVQLRGEGVLKMQDESNAWLTYSTHIRACSGKDSYKEPWVKTANPFLETLSGALDTSHSSVSASDLLGYEATFACGTRLDIYNGVETPGSFRDCVKQGVGTNKKLRSDNPTEPFLKDEIIVQVKFAPMDECFHETDITGINSDNETENPVFRDFEGMKNSCKPLSQAGALPADLVTLKSSEEYRGMLLGTGVPKDTLEEVLLDPRDILSEVKL